MDYDICLSFAGEDRKYVDAVAAALRERGVTVFYDLHDQASLWGKDLQLHLDNIFRKACRFCVLFISKHSVEKAWPSHERASALARALQEAEEYVLPARFDSTEVPGLRPTIGYVELADFSPTQLADLICSKLEHGIPSINGKSSYRWPETLQLGTGERRVELSTFQGIPIRINLPYIIDIIAAAIDAISANIKEEGAHIYWTHAEDRRFDRLYATSAVALALTEIGLPHDDPLISRSISYLLTTNPSDIDDRAASITLLLMQCLKEAEVCQFLEAVQASQIDELGSPLYGSFLLTQGASKDTAPNSHWTTSSIHANGASFHACHLADCLLHIPASNLKARRLASTILDGIRKYISNELNNNKGWLLDIQGNKTPLTLYGLALCPLLGIPLPVNWRETADEVFERIPSYPPLTRWFGIKNAWYMTLTIAADGGFAEITKQVGETNLLSLPSPESIHQLQVRDIAALLGAIIASLQLIDKNLLAALYRPINNLARDQPEGRDNP